MTKFKRACYIMNEANQQAAIDDGYGWLRGIEPPKTIKYLDKEVLWTEDSGCITFGSRQCAEKGLGFEVHEHYPTIDPALNKEENIMKQEFTKADLKTGMVVETRLGVKYTVMLNCYGNGGVAIDEMVTVNALVRENGWNSLDNNYNDDLTCEGSKIDAIDKVYVPQYYACIMEENPDMLLLWERKLPSKPSEAEIKLQELKELHEETAKKIAELSKEIEGGTL